MKEKCDCCQETVENGVCNCCDGIDVAPPVPIYNRPGLRQLAYRVGTHSAFLASMKARLSGFYFENRGSDGNLARTYPLEKLTTRNSSDPAIALLDSWATVADVLSFYQERIANEGYLRTATERRSVVELANLVGYRPRPGVSASVFLAYTMDPNIPEEVIIPAGSRVQSIPGADEMPQAFETGEALKAKAQWNNLKPRMTQAQTKETIKGGERIYLKGIATNLKANDALVIDFGDKIPLFFTHIHDVLPDNPSDRTLVTFSESPTVDFQVVPVVDVINRLIMPASLQPPNKFQLQKNQGNNLAGQFALKNGVGLKSTDISHGVFAPSTGTQTDIRPQAQAGYSVLSVFSSVLNKHLPTATASVKLTEKKIKVYQMGVKAALFGHNLPLPLNGSCYPDSTDPGIRLKATAKATSDSKFLQTLALDAEYQNIKVGDYIAIKTGQNPVRCAKVDAVRVSTLGGPSIDNDLAFFSTCPTITTIKVGDRKTFTEAEPIKTKVTVLTLDSDWRHIETTNSIIKNTTVYIQNAKFELAEESITDPVCGGKDETIELDGFYRDLEAGRWVIVSGERSDISGVRFSELALLASVKHDIVQDLPDESLHTYIQLAEKLAYCFKRETVTIYGNVIKATHGETRPEVLGSGDGAKPLQNFTLKQFPLTHVSAANPSGTASTLKVYVNNIEWREIDSLVGLGANDRRFITRTDDENKTSVVFGNGKQGARLPTGIENIRAEYRNGIGKAGNVKAEQISLLVSRPLGVKEVINPLRASGGADRESRDQARRHVPLAVKAMDRLVSTQDYEDFSRVYAGIGKAYAIELSNGRLPLIHVTVAGADDIPIDTSSDLFRNLRQALYDSGDPFQKIQLAVRELLLIVIEAGIAILPGYRWEFVADEVRIRLLDQFSFERRELGQDVLLSEVISVMQSVAGVAYVDVNAFGGIPEKQPLTAAEIKLLTNHDSPPLPDNRRLLTPDEIADEVSKIISRIQHLTEEQLKALPAGEPFLVPQRLVVDLPEQEQFIRPAQLAILSPDVPATLILNQIK